MAAPIQMPQVEPPTNPPSPPRAFKDAEVPIVDSTEPLEEEGLEKFSTEDCYPVNVGDVIGSRYQVIEKLGYGRSSTVWLARDPNDHRYVARKFYSRSGFTEHEFKVYQTLSESDRSHPGSSYVRTAIDIIIIPREGGDHGCFVQKPMWDSLNHLLQRNPSQSFPLELIKPCLLEVFVALDFLHTECKLIYTDIKGDNILLGIEDESILDDFTTAELQDPSLRKRLDNYTVYVSRAFNLPNKIGRAVLSDFGSVMDGSKIQTSDEQPDVYRCPEVMLKAEWSYEINIWNVGVMIWDLFEGKHTFHGQDPDGKGYSTRVHLAEVVGMIGPFQLIFFTKEDAVENFFSMDGKWIADVDVQTMSLESSEEKLEKDEKDRFLAFMRGMMQWRPEDRKTARQLLEDPWLNDL